MTGSSTPRTLPSVLRFSLLIAALLLIGSIFVIMRALFLPSQYLQAYKAVLNGPSQVSEFKKQPILSFTKLMYLVGPLNSASGQKNGPIFPYRAEPILAPTTFSDATGAVEVLATTYPETRTSITGYMYNQPLHMLGWRISESGYSLFIIGQSKEDVLELLLRASKNWKSTLFIQGLLLLGATFLIFWFLNMAALSNVFIHYIQILIVNVIYLILLFSALVLSGYPLGATLPMLLVILAIGNAVFIPVSMFLKPRPSATGKGGK